MGKLKRVENSNSNRKELDLANYLKVESWFKENKPDVVVVAAAKVGGIIANSNEPFNFLLKILKYKIILLKILGKTELKDYYFWEVAAFTQKIQSNPSKKNIYLLILLKKLTNHMLLQK